MIRYLRNRRARRAAHAYMAEVMATLPTPQVPIRRPAGDLSIAEALAFANHDRVLV